MVSIQSNMQIHDELAALFQRNLTFNPQLQEPKPEPTSAQPIIYSVSQHYNHSAHVRPAAQQNEIHRPSSEPPQSETLSIEIILKNHGVNPSTLTPSQIQLFKVADTPQKMRLLELWTICPPSQGGDIPSLAWSSTTVEQEEQLAKMRYERSNENQVMSLDGTTVQSGNGTWIQNSDTDVEPYMTSGYEELMRRDDERQSQQNQPRDTYSYTTATDPVYMGPDYVRQQQHMDMATQYGAFQYFRGGEADTMDVM